MIPLGWGLIVGESPGFGWYCPRWVWAWCLDSVGDLLRESRGRLVGEKEVGASSNVQSKFVNPVITSAKRDVIPLGWGLIIFSQKLHLTHSVKRHVAQGFVGDGVFEISFASPSSIFSIRKFSNVVRSLPLTYALSKRAF